MKRFLLVIPVVLMTAACETPEQTVAAGALAGAALNDGNRLEGAAVGAAAGGLTAAVIHQRQNPQCTYRNTRTGETYRADCPR